MTYAISDIHGCHKTFVSLLEKIAFTKGDTLFLLGDYVDRGPDSKGVIDTIMGLMADGYKVQCLSGNHEAAMLKGISHSGIFLRWQRLYGGMATLESFGIEELTDLPHQYVDFLGNLRPFIEYEQFILVHAGLNFVASNPLSDEESMLEIRQWYDFIDRDWLGNRIIVHGHTPQSVRATKQQLAQLETQGYLNIDNGCVYHRTKLQDGYGFLSAFDLTNQRLFCVENCDK